LRHDAGEDFVYLGEIRYHTHRQFATEPDGRVQQEYVFDLLERLPESILVELSQGIRASSRRSTIRPGGSGPVRTRRPATLDGYKKAFSYALARLDRTVEPAHHNYQVRLKPCHREQTDERQPGAVAQGDADARR
jgi:hypothetical protein